jgi:hypothetical protein
MHRRKAFAGGAFGAVNKVLLQIKLADMQTPLSLPSAFEKTVYSRVVEVADL